MAFRSKTDYAPQHSRPGQLFPAKNFDQFLVQRFTLVLVPFADKDPHQDLIAVQHAHHPPPIPARTSVIPSQMANRPSSR